MFMIAGRIVRAPKKIAAADHKSFLFTVAVPRTYKNREGKIDTDFISVQSPYIADPNKVTIYDTLKKGDIVVVDGNIRSYQSQKDGETVYGQNLVARNVKRLSSGKVADDAAAEAIAAATAEDVEETPDQA